MVYTTYIKAKMLNRQNIIAQSLQYMTGHWYSILNLIG